QELPHGYLTEEEFAYIEKLVTHDTKKASRLELAALIRLLEKATAAPEAMSSFVMEQVKLCITSKIVPSVETGDLALIQCLLYGIGGQSSIGISREEADLLFDINDAARGADNAQGWQDLFVKAIAAHLMQHVGYKPLPRREALRLSSWVSDTSVRPGRFFQRMVSGGLRAISEAYDADANSLQDAWQAKNADNRLKADLARHVTDEEGNWLVARIGKDGVFDEAERSVLVYISDHLNAALPKNLAELAKVADVKAA
ncbi:MAG: hypothetical protein AAGH60_12290, partial [Pseudomonadota bacterium]